MRRGRVVGAAAAGLTAVAVRDPTSKGVRCAQYVDSCRKELVKVTEAVGVAHPGVLTPDDIDILCGDHDACSLRAVHGYEDGWELGPELARDLVALPGHR